MSSPAASSSSVVLMRVICCCFIGCFSADSSSLPPVPRDARRRAKTMSNRTTSTTASAAVTVLEERSGASLLQPSTPGRTSEGSETRGPRCALSRYEELPLLPRTWSRERSTRSRSKLFSRRAGCSYSCQRSSPARRYSSERAVSRAHPRRSRGSLSSRAAHSWDTSVIRSHSGAFGGRSNLWGGSVRAANSGPGTPHPAEVRACTRNV
mmetsp:Transcript_19348/g.39549  ORF Transcript_19348/g.39549 Transcript_19348/m.39549 type:complete len:209 (-) Transcript_19348:1344-1970(-)